MVMQASGEAVPSPAQAYKCFFQCVCLGEEGEGEGEECLYECSQSIPFKLLKALIPIDNGPLEQLKDTFP